MQQISSVSMRNINDLNIVMVQKIKLNGDLCAKSMRVVQDLKARNLLEQIHHIFIADERDFASTGYKLAAQYNVDAAPFFIVTIENGSTLVYTAYQRFLKEVLEQPTSDSDEIAEIIAQNSVLDFI